MKKMSVSDKITAMVAFLLFFELAVAMALAASCMIDYHFYAKDSRVYAFEEAMRVKTTNEFEDIVNYYSLHLKTLDDSATNTELYRLKEYEKKYSKTRSNVLFIASRDDNTAVLCNFDDEVINSIYDTSYSNSMVFEFYDSEDIKVSGTIKLFIRKNMTASDDYYLAAKLIEAAHVVKYPLLVLFVVFSLGALVVLGKLISKSGVRENGKISDPRFIDRVPFDMLIIAAAAAISFLVGLIVLTSVANVKKQNIVLWNAIILLLSFLFALIILLMNLTIAARIKHGHVLKNTLVFIFISRIRKMMGKENDGYFKLPYIGKVLLTIGLVITADILIMLYFVFKYLTNQTGDIKDFPFLIFAAIHAAAIFVLVPLFIMIIVNLNHIRESGQKIAEGDLEHDVDSLMMFGDFKLIGENLSNIKRDMIEAVKEKAKNQEVRNELITNISHDLKTPLTSIVNYVNLLQRGDTTPAQATEYLEIIKKHSGRLDTLLKGVIDISKIATGDIPVNMTAIDIKMFTVQSVSEFEGRFEALSLETIVSAPDSDVYIRADGDLLWRIYQNLFENICKYSKECTRLFIDIKNNGERVAISFRNTSNIIISASGDELLRRFKREDSSRHTDGYGLGLSIAESLTEIQNGVFKIEADGDIFRSVMSFESADPPDGRK